LSTIKRVIMGWNSSETSAGIMKQIGDINPNVEIAFAKVENGKIIA